MSPILYGILEHLLVNLVLPVVGISVVVGYVVYKLSRYLDN